MTTPTTWAHARDIRTGHRIHWAGQWHAITNAYTEGGHRTIELDNGQTLRAPIGAQIPTAPRTTR